MSLLHGLSSSQISKINQITQNVLFSIPNKSIPLSTYLEQVASIKCSLIETEGELQAIYSKDMLEDRLSNDKISRELSALMQKSRDAGLSVKAESRLELGIERGHLRDGLGRAKLKLHELSNGIEIEATNAQTALVKLRNDIFYSLIGFFFTSAAAFLGYLRYSTG
jgi:hypothetical protein